MSHRPMTLAKANKIVAAPGVYENQVLLDALRRIQQERQSYELAEQTLRIEIKKRMGEKV